MTFHGMYSAKIKNSSLLLPWKLPKKTLYGYIINNREGKPCVIISAQKPTDSESGEADVTYSFTFCHHHGRWNNIPREVTFALGEEVYIIGGYDRMELYRKSDFDDEKYRKETEELEAELKKILEDVLKKKDKASYNIYKAKNGKNYLV